MTRKVFTPCVPPDRLTVRGDSLTSILNNHAELMDLWDWSLGEFTDTEMKARIQGAKPKCKHSLSFSVVRRPQRSESKLIT